jgi:ubiquinone/menaquinone biosynthesis C-methylase UbiE
MKLRKIGDALIGPIYKDRPGKMEMAFLQYLVIKILDTIHEYFMVKSNYGGVEIPLKEMENTLEIARNKGWRFAIRKIGLNYPDLLTNTMSSATMDWLFHCLNYAKTGTCLNVGSGWGANTFGLARYYEEVWSLDADGQKLEFQKIRQKQDRIDNVYFARTDCLHLPFPDDYFDLIAANDILECVGFIDHSRTPRQLQIAFLKEIRRMLKPGGCLYLGTENRFSLSSLLGAIDHSGPPFASIVPRKKENLTVRATGKAWDYRKRIQMKRQGENRPCTHSLAGYQKLLSESNYDFVDLFWSSSHNMPQFSGRFDDNSFSFYLKFIRKDNSRKRNFSSLLKSISVCIPNPILKLANRLLCQSFLIFGYKENKGSSFESKIVNTDNKNAGFLKISGGHSMDSKINYFILKDNKPVSVIRFPRDRNSVSLALEEAKLTQFNGINIKKQRIDRVPVFIEPMIPGNHPLRLNFSHNQKVLRWLLNFQNVTKNGYWNLDDLQAEMQELIIFLKKMGLANELEIKIQAKMITFIDYLEKFKIPIVSEHGDYFNGNIIINNANVYVLDWEFYKEKGNPFFDFIYFLFNNAARETSTNFFRDNDNNIRCGGKYSVIFDSLITEFIGEKNLPPEIIFQAFPYVVLRCLRRSASGENNRHLNINHHIELLKWWEEKYPSTKVR